MFVPFNRPYEAKNTEKNLLRVVNEKHWSGDGAFTKRCVSFLSDKLNGASVLLTPSGTDALEMCAILLNLSPGDEIIMPSFTFTSTANAFVLRGAVPVFVDVCRDTLNIDPDLIESAITANTKAVVVVHYAGIACDMDRIKQLCQIHKLFLIEDAAHAIGSTYRGLPLGSIGHLNAFSFHETKNFSSGEGGAFATSNKEFFQRAEIIREKGTNRSEFFRGQVDKYTWVDLGSSYLPSEFQSAVLWSHFEEFAEIASSRMRVWNTYHEALESEEKRERVKRPHVPSDCTHNAHLYYLLLNSLDQRTRCIDFLKSHGISSVFHYVPLHSAPAGRKFGRIASSLQTTDEASERLVRLPLWTGLTDDQVQFVAEKVIEFIRHTK